MNHEELLIRQATVSDKQALLNFEQAVIEAERPFNSQIKDQAHYYDIDHLIKSDTSCLIVAQYNGDIIGTGYVSIRASKHSLVHEQHGYLGFMFVSPEYRGQGVNQRVIDALIEWAKSKSIHDFYLDVYSENQAAINAYEKLGFKPTLLEMKVNIAQ